MIGLSQVRLFFPHRFPFQIDGVGVVHKSVEDGIGKRWVADDLVPLFNRKNLEPKIKGHSQNQFRDPFVGVL
ncbi:MAG: hypothetical protein ACI915_004544 [Gammaproteobacteria bacterium]